MNLRAAELKSVAFGALSAGTLDKGLDIHKVVGQMVMAVANIAENRPGTKTKGVGGAVIQNNGERVLRRETPKEEGISCG
jgi:O-acetyl-ADP-ribose deacetylase (regulator of RNase III)